MKDTRLKRSWKKFKAEWSYCYFNIYYDLKIALSKCLKSNTTKARTGNKDIKQLSASIMNG